MTFEISVKYFAYIAIYGIINLDKGDWKMVGNLVTFEGGEGSGKSTLINALKQYLDEHKINYEAVREPGGLELCEEIRNILKYSKQNINSRAEFLLFSASRAQLVHEFIVPELLKGKLVLCDRYYDSSRVYQGYAGDIDDKDIMKVTNFATNKLVPKLTFFLDIDPVVAFERKGGQDKNDRIEQRNIKFHQKVREGYLKLASEEKRFVVLDATTPVDKLVEIVVAKMKEAKVI